MLSTCELFMESSESDILKDVPKVTKNEFINQCQSGDIVVSYYRKYPTFMKMITSKVNSIAQRSQYSSSKLVYDNKHIVGFGASPVTPFKLTKRKLNGFISNIKYGCLIRYKNIDDDKQTKIMTHADNLLNSDYSLKNLYSSLWKRFTNSSDGNNFTSDIRESLFCSSFIAYVYNKSNITTDFTNNVLFTWPKDFIYSDDMIKVCRL